MRKDTVEFKAIKELAKFKLSDSYREIEKMTRDLPKDIILNELVLAVIMLHKERKRYARLETKYKKLKKWNTGK